MKEITGVLKTLGSGSTRHGNVGSSFVKYNTIEIGDTLLQKVVSSQSLNDFVERGLGKEVTLFLNKNMLKQRCVDQGIRNVYNTALACSECSLTGPGRTMATRH